MKKILIQYGVCALAVALMVPLAQAQAAFGKDAGTPAKKRRGEPVLVSPCTLCPPGFRPSLAGCVAGVKFLLLHLPPLASLEATCDEHNEATNKSLLRGPSIIFRGNGLARRVESPQCARWSRSEQTSSLASWLKSYSTWSTISLMSCLTTIPSASSRLRF